MHNKKLCEIIRKITSRRFLIFTGLIFYPGTLVFCYVITRFLGKPLTLAGHALVWLSALGFCSIFLVKNTFDYIYYKKRCFNSLREWYTEERYSTARRRAMYPPIRKELLFKEITGICLGKTGWGPFKRYVCIDLYNKHLANHLAIVGNSSAGKSSGPVLSTLIGNFMNCDDNTPPPITFIVIDPKPELAQLSSEKGCKWVKVLNPKDRTTYGWDLYFDITPESDIDRVTDRIETIINVVVLDTNSDNAFFMDSARNVAVGCLIYEFIVHGLNFIKSIRLMLSRDLDLYIKKIKEDPQCPKKCLMLLAEFGNETDQSNATQDIKKSLKQQMAVFTRTDTEWFLDTDVNKKKCSPSNLNNGQSLFLSIPRADLTTFGVLFRIIINQVSDYLSRRKDDDPEDKPVAIVVDEFTNIGGPIPNLSENLGFIRSKKVFYITIFQQYSALQKVYGREDARTILNMGHQLALSCEDNDLGKVFSDKAGEFTDTRKTYKKNGGLFSLVFGEDSLSETKEKRLRVMNDLSSLIPRYESIAFINGSEYIRFSKFRYYEDKKLNQRSQECALSHQSKKER